MDRSITNSRQFQPGAIVDASDGKIGSLVEIISASQPGDADLLVVRQDRDGRLVRIPSHTVDFATSDADTVQLLIAEVDLPRYVDVIGSAAGGTPSLIDVGEHVTVRRYEEVLEPTKHSVEAGSIAIRKRVETVPAEVDVEVGRDEIAVERVPINRPIDAVPSVRQEGDTMIIPVVEEILVTEKRLMLREEVRVRRRQRFETVNVRDTVRREVIEVEDHTTPVAGYTPAADPPAPTTGGKSTADPPIA
jgi:uncharacterized protein (TIGR02271 family)